MTLLQLLVSETDFLLTSSAVLSGTVILIYCVRWCINQMRKMSKYKTAPCANVSFSGLSKRLISGQIHTVWLPYIDELKSHVFRIPTFLIPRFIICDPILAKIVLEGDPKSKCPAADKGPNLRILNN